MRVFGCLCFPLFPSTSIHKLQERSTPCAYLGPAPNHRGSKCYDMSSGTIIICRHVRFVENEFPFSKTHKTTPSDYDCLSDNVIPSILHSIPQQQPSQHAQPDSMPQPNSFSPIHHTGPHTHTDPIREPSSTAHNASPLIPQMGQSILPPITTPTPTLASPDSAGPVHCSVQTSPPSTPQPATTSVLSPTTVIHSPPRSTNPVSHCMTTRAFNGIYKPNPKYFSNLHVSTTTNISTIPKNPISALRDQNWKNAMLDEFTALIDNKTWELVPRPPNVNVIRSMWIFRHKHKSDGSFERYKARLVGDGKTQQQGVDCDETFSPVVKPATIRAVLSIALSKSWPIHQMDVKNSFLHGNLDETVYMHQPMGFRDKNYPDHVCRLKKSLYGLKQAPRAWYQRFADFVATIRFSHSKSDHSLFIYKNGSDIAYILLYVDDIILTASSDRLRKYIMTLLAYEFAMKDLGPLSFFLGIAVTRHAHGLFLSQT